MARGSSGICVGCRVGMWAETGRCHRGMPGEGILCQGFYYPGCKPVTCTCVSALSCVDGGRWGAPWLPVSPPECSQKGTRD